MADTPYEFDVLDDFPNQMVDDAALQHQVEQSAIASAAILYVETSWKGDPARNKCDVWFDDPLSGADEIALGGIVAAHDGQPYIEPEVLDAPVTAPSFAVGSGDSEIAEDGGGNMTLTDAISGTRTLAELANLSKVLLDVDGTFTYEDDGDILTEV